MKNILRFTFVATLIMVCFNLNAQTFRIEAGYLQPVRYSDPMSNRYFNGVRLGGTVDFQLPVKFLTIHTGLLYSFTFSNDVQKFQPVSDSLIFKTQGHYLDIPLHLTATYTIKAIKLFAFAGPNFNIGLYQPQEIISNLTNEYVEQWLSEQGIEAGRKDLYKGDLRRFNFQLEAGAGIQWRRYLVKGGYSFGINDLSKSDITKQHQSGWYVTAGFEF